jgi:hypothetical protein
MIEKPINAGNLPKCINNQRKNFRIIISFSWTLGREKKILQKRSAGLIQRQVTYITAMAEFAHCKAASDLVGFSESQPLIVMALGSQVLNSAAPQVDVHSKLDGERVVEEAKSLEKRGPFQSILHGRVRQPALEHALAPEEQNALQSFLPVLFHRRVEVRRGEHPVAHSFPHKQIAA